MFALRGVAVSLTFFVLTYCFLSALIALVWRACSASLVPMFCPVQARGPSTQLGSRVRPCHHTSHTTGLLGCSQYGFCRWRLRLWLHSGL